MKKIYYYLMGLMTIVAIGSTLLLSSCKKETDDDILNEQIAASKEMEDYIIAGYEMQAALQELQRVLNNMNFLKSPVGKDDQGRNMIKLPLESLIMEAKIKKFNELKDALQNKFPRLTTLNKESSVRIIEKCMLNSENVSGKLLDMGVETLLPITKRELEPGNLPPTRQQMLDSLSNWTSRIGNPELVFIMYQNGNYDTYLSASNKDDEAYSPTFHYSVKENKTWWRGGSFPDVPIIGIGHTHFWNDSVSGDDSAARRYPGATNYIFYNGKLTEF